MGTTWFVILCILNIFQDPLLVTAENPTCVPGFQSDQLTFSVIRKQLRRGTVLGKVGFTDCTDRTRFLFSTSDSRFVVKTDGVLMVNRPVVLHEGHLDFFIHSRDSQGRKMTVPASVSMSAADPQVPVLQFPEPVEGLRRRKRDWVVPPLSVSENHRGPYPLKVAQVRSNEDKTKKIYYSITGPGANLPPINRFTMDRNTGNLYVTQPLDREETAMYTFELHAVGDVGGIVEEPMEIVVNIFDQNDNKPVFVQSTYTVGLLETAVVGSEVITVLATDRDEADNVYSELRYRILRQEPQLPRDNMFAINPLSGIITLTGTGLDRKKYPQYTLVVEAADLEGEGLSAQAKVIIKVTDASSMDIFVAENSRGPYPLKLAQMRSDDAQVKKLYSITGPGADQPPVGLFTMDRDTGNLYITQPVDREERAKYMLQVRAVPEGADHAEELTALTVKVVDQNDNRPTFTQDTFMGEVSDSSVKGSEVIKVTATDIDEPNCGNSYIRYSIVSQEPQLPSDNMFEINPVSGAISVAGSGLNRDQHPQYTLVVKAADMVGEGLSTQANVILKVTDDITVVFFTGGWWRASSPGNRFRHPVPARKQKRGEKEQSDTRDIYHCNGGLFF